MDSAQQNWLAFSLSNQYHHLPPSSQLSLLHAFNPSSSGVTVGAEENGNAGGAGGATTRAAAAEDLSMVVNSPKLADFLGGAAAGGHICSADNAADDHMISQHKLGGGGSETSSTVAVVNSSEMYDSELKTIAASFLRGYSTDLHQLELSHKQLAVVVPPVDPLAKKPTDTFGQRTSIYRGVTRHRWTGRYEAHLWDNTCRREGQSRKGRQVYLGGYDKEEKAARAYDLAALKYWGPTTTTNFPIISYEKELEEMKHMTRQEFVASLRRRSSGFSRGASIYRGVTRHHQHGRWQARIGRVAGNKDLYLGTFSTQEEAAEAYDIAAIKFRGLNAVTNFDMSRYDVKSIATSNLPIGNNNNNNKQPKTSSDQSLSDNKSGGGGGDGSRDHLSSSATSIAATFVPQQPSTSTLAFGLPPVKHDTWDFWSSIGYHGHHSCDQFNSTINNPSPNFNNMIGGEESNKMNVFLGNGGAYTENHHHRYNNIQHQQQLHMMMQEQSSTGGGGVTSINEEDDRGISSNSSYDNNPTASYGNWNSTSNHSFQTAKNNLSVIQTAIFGME